MSDKKIVLLLALLFIVPSVFASSFNFYSSSSSVEDLCPRATGLFVDAMENTGSDALEFSISSSGSAAVFATSMPTGFVLMPGETKYVYTYVTPMSSVSPGNYFLNLVASANGENEELNHEVLVNDCYEYNFVSLEDSADVCPCESAQFRFKVENVGRYSEAYLLHVEGEYADNVVLSQESLTLSPGESKEILAYVKSSCSDIGVHSFNVVVESVNGNSVKSQSATFKVNSCYDFEVHTTQDFVDMCDHTESAVEISLVNEGTSENSYDLEVEGPMWAVLENNRVQLGPGESKNVKLTFVPDYGVEGNFQVTFSATPEMGDTKAVSVFNVNVRKCSGVFASLEKNNDKICDGLENDYKLTIKNQGEFKNEFFIELDGPEWVELENADISLDAGEEKEVILKVKPGYDVAPGKYDIKVNVVAKDSDKISDSDSLQIETVSRETCYKAELELERDSIELYYDSSATIPITVKNLGADAASYSLSVGGTASNFVYLNPSVVSLNPGESDVSYLYIAPSNEVDNGDYEASIVVRLEDSTILDTKSVKIKINDKPVKQDVAVPEIEDYMPENKTSLWSKIAGFFSGLFGKNGEEEVIEETEEKREAEGVNKLLNVGDMVGFKIGEEDHTMKINELTNDSVLIEISSRTIYVQMNVGNKRLIDMDGDGVNDLELVFNGVKDGKADLSYKVLEKNEEGVEGGTLENNTASVGLNNENTSGKGFFGKFFASLGFIFLTIFNWIIGSIGKIIVLLVIIVFLIVLVKSNAWKSIMKFFEEEIEEEELVVDKKNDKKEEKKKKEVVKKESKKDEKKEEVVEKKEKPKKKDKEEKKEEVVSDKDLEVDAEEDDEFIIEFDDD